MNHQRAHRRFNRTSSHRKAMLSSLTNALLQHEQIETTEEKAKDLRGVVERLITRAKVDSVANRRLVSSKIGNDKNVVKLFTDIGPHFKERAGGYTRVLKTRFRDGDAASMAVIQLVDRGSKIMALKAALPRPRRVEEETVE